MLAACFALSFALYLQNETHRRVGLAADAAPEPEILPDHRLLPAERLEFAGRQEGCRYLLGVTVFTIKALIAIPLALMVVGAVWMLWTLIRL